MGSGKGCVMTRARGAAAPSEPAGIAGAVGAAVWGSGPSG
ncbi:hypothetical protein HMPREF0321_2850 [Dermacoccus sp. Ellin185]|nr:hypothetical protein HMPREF0321_2850 [Dermacoccus sp. Ellin185]